jgi:hypothetical protein
MTAPKFILTRDDPKDVRVTVTIDGHTESFMMSSAILDLDTTEICEESINGRFTARGLALRDVREDVGRAFNGVFLQWSRARAGKL